MPSARFSKNASMNEGSSATPRGTLEKLVRNKHVAEQLAVLHERVVVDFNAEASQIQLGEDGDRPGILPRCMW